MNKEEVLQAVADWAEGVEWYVVVCEDRSQPDDYIIGFEEAMGELVEYSKQAAPKKNLALAVPFSSSTRGEKRSYRRALKKYTRSTVFLDLNIHLMLVRDDASVLYISADNINAFLEDLNHYIAQGNR